MSFLLEIAIGFLAMSIMPLTWDNPGCSLEKPSEKLGHFGIASVSNHHSSGPGNLTAITSPPLVAMPLRTRGVTLGARMRAKRSMRHKSRGVNGLVLWGMLEGNPLDLSSQICSFLETRWNFMSAAGRGKNWMGLYLYIYYSFSMLFPLRKDAGQHSATFSLHRRRRFLYCFLENRTQWM